MADDKSKSNESSSVEIATPEVEKHIRTSHFKVEHSDTGHKKEWEGKKDRYTGHGRMVTHSTPFKGPGGEKWHHVHMSNGQIESLPDKVHAHIAEKTQKKDHIHRISVQDKQKDSRYSGSGQMFVPGGALKGNKEMKKSESMFKSEEQQIAEMALKKNTPADEGNEAAKADANKDKHDEFKFHRQMAANHGATSQHHWDRYEDDSKSSDHEISRGSREHRNLAIHHSNQAERHLRSAKSLHNEKKHGPWNSTIPVGHKIESMKKSEMFKSEEAEIETLAKAERPKGRLMGDGSDWRVETDSKRGNTYTHPIHGTVEEDKMHNGGRHFSKHPSEKNLSEESHSSWPNARKHLEAITRFKASSMKKSEALNKSEEHLLAPIGSVHKVDWDGPSHVKVTKHSNGKTHFKRSNKSGKITAGSEQSDTHANFHSWVNKMNKAEKGVHASMDEKPKGGTSKAGSANLQAKRIKDAGAKYIVPKRVEGLENQSREEHKRVLSEIKEMPKPNLTKVEPGSLHKPEKDAIDQYMKMEKAEKSKSWEHHQQKYEHHVSRSEHYKQKDEGEDSGFDAPHAGQVHLHNEKADHHLAQMRKINPIKTHEHYGDVGPHTDPNSPF